MKVLKRVKIDGKWYKVVATLSWEERERRSGACVFALRCEEDGSLVFFNGGATLENVSNVWVPGSPAIAKMWEQAGLIPTIETEFGESD